MVENTSFVKWEDISNICREASSLLKDDSPMIFTENFSLFEAMSAVELMDSKMDPCSTIPGSIKLEDLLKYKFPENMSLQIVCEVLQSLFICEMQFYGGASILESLHQCVFTWEETLVQLEKSEDLYNKIIYGYCKDLMCSSSYVMQSVLHADVYEDEDFLPFPKLDIPSYSEVNIYSKELINILDPTVPYGSTIIILLTLRFHIQQLFISIESFIKLGMNMKSLYKNNHDDDDNNNNNGKESALPMIHNIELFTQNILNILINPDIKNLNDLQPHISNPSVTFAFDPSAARAQQFTPIRFIPFTSFLTSMTYLHQICTELKEICTTMRTIIQSRTTLNYENLIQVCSHCCHQNYHLFSRSLLWAGLHFVYNDMIPLLQNSISILGIPSAIYQSDILNNWMKSKLRVFWDSLRVFMTHRSKLLPRLDNIFNHWSVIQKEASYIDERYLEVNNISDPQNILQYVSNWTVLLVSILMDTHMGIVVEADLLAPSELDYFYWYWDYVLSVKAYTLVMLKELNFKLKMDSYNEMKLSSIEALKALKANKSSNSKKDKNRNKMKSELQRIIDEPIPMKDDNFSIDELVTKARSSIYKGLYKLYFLLSSIGLNDKKDNLYTTWNHRFEFRFRAFLPIITPSPVDYETYRTTSLAIGQQSVEDILSSVSASFKSAKSLLDGARKIQCVSISDTIVSTQLLILCKVCYLRIILIT